MLKDLWDLVRGTWADARGVPQLTDGREHETRAEIVGWEPRPEQRSSRPCPNRQPVSSDVQLVVEVVMKTLDDKIAVKERMVLEVMRQNRSESLRLGEQAAGLKEAREAVERVVREVVIRLALERSR